MKITKYFANFAFYGFPLLFVLWIAVTELTMGLSEKKYFYSEYGPVELSHEIGLFITLCFGVWLYRAIKPTEEKLLKIWVGIALLGCLYSLGEEISWGQTFFHWQTPEEWAKLNGQGETNLHNTSHLLNQLPKSVLEIGVFIGGLVIPLLKKWKSEKLPAKFSVLYADCKVLPVAFLALTVKLLELAPGELGVQIFWRKSEVIESVLFHFVLVYLIDMAMKWKMEGRLRA